MGPSAAPPTLQEISRKLSVRHARNVKPPSLALATPASPPGTHSQAHDRVSVPESDSDSVGSPVLLSPTPHSLASSGALLSATSASTGAGSAMGSATGIEPVHQMPLSSIAERREDGDEESEEDDDEEGWLHAVDNSHNPRVIHDAGAIRSGYLDKRNGHRNSWKRRWFVLRAAHLAYYKSSAEYKPLRLLDLAGIHGCTPVTLKNALHTFGVVSASRPFYLRAESEEEVTSWTREILKARDALVGSAPVAHDHSHPHVHASTITTTTSPPIPVPVATHTGMVSVALTPSPPRGLHAQMMTTSESEEGSPSAQRVLSGSPQQQQQSGVLVHGATTMHVQVQTPTHGTSSSSPGRGGGKDGASKVVLSGYLMKCGSKRHNWRKRWFTLYSEKLEYSGSHMDTRPHRQFSVSEILDAFEFDIRSHKHGVGGPQPASLGSGVEHTFKIVATKRTLLVCAPSEEEEIRWLSAIRALIARRTGGEGGSRHKGKGLSVSGPGEGM